MARARIPRLPDGAGEALATVRSHPAGRWGSTALGALVAWVLLGALLPNGAPAGIVLQGAVLGAINALVALTIVLVYRANRVLNFSAASFGSVAAVMAIELHVQLGLNYFLSVVAGLVLAGLLGMVLEATVIRRFGNAPRLIVAVATIGLAQVLDGVSIIIPYEWSGTKSGDFTTPFTWHFRIFPVLFNGNYVVALILVPVVMIALTWFLRYSSYGVAIRAAADNGERARLLGLPVNRLSTIVWTITGVLSALAVLLRVPILGFLSFDSVSMNGPDLLLQTFTAAIIGGMTSLPVTVVAAVGLGIASQLAAWTWHDATYVDVVQLGIILVVLVARRERLTRAAESGISTWQAIRQVRPVPPEMSRLSQVVVGTQVTRIGLLALALGLPFLISDAHTQLASVILIYGMVAASLVVLTGWAGHISLGQVAFMGFGGATTGMLISHHHWDMFLALAVGTLVAAAIAVVIGIPALRISGPFLGVVTLGLAVTAATYFLVPRYFPWFVPTDSINRPAIFGRIATDTDRQMYYVTLLGLALTLAAVRGLRNSHAGRAMIASNDNRLATQSFAIDTTRVNLVAFAISGAIAGLAGGLFVLQQEGFNPNSFDAADGLRFFTMVVIGGLGSIPGAVMGAIYVYGAMYLLPPGWSVLASGAGMLLLLMLAPGGLGELVFRGRDHLLRMLARREGLVVPSLLADVRTGDEPVPYPDPDSELAAGRPV